jgi:hypothetical protein
MLHMGSELMLTLKQASWLTALTFVLKADGIT